MVEVVYPGVFDQGSIPDTWVNIRGHDKVHGDGPRLFRIDLRGG